MTVVRKVWKITESSVYVATMFETPLRDSFLSRLLWGKRHSSFQCLKITASGGRFKIQSFFSRVDKLAGASRQGAFGAKKR